MCGGTVVNNSHVGGVFLCLKNYEPSRPIKSSWTLLTRNVTLN